MRQQGETGPLRQVRCLTQATCLVTTQTGQPLTQHPTWKGSEEAPDLGVLYLMRPHPGPPSCPQSLLPPALPAAETGLHLRQGPTLSLANSHAVTNPGSHTDGHEAPQARPKQDPESLFFFFFQMQFFSNIACNSFGAGIWGRGRMGKAREEKKGKKQPIAQSLSPEKPRLWGWSGRVAPSPRPPG